MMTLLIQKKIKDDTMNEEARHAQPKGHLVIIL